MRKARRLIREASNLFLFATLTTLFLCYSAEAELVSHWAAEGNPSDSAGLNHGTEVGTVNYLAGQVGQAFSLAGTGHINVADPVAGGLESVTGFTVAAWIFLDSHSSGAPVANLRTTANTSGFTLEPTSANTMGFVVNTTGAFSSYGMGVSASGWTFGTFYHVAATFDAATHSIVLYRDGEVVASRNDLPGTEMIANPASGFQIGGNIVQGQRWDGRIDELRFYNRPLSQSEIQDIMTTLQFTVGGTVTGLTGDQVVLQNNGGDDLAIGADGDFTFASPLADHSDYEVSILSQPDEPVQTCQVTNGSGTLSGENVTDIEVQCWPDSIFADQFEQEQ